MFWRIFKKREKSFRSDRSKRPACYSGEISTEVFRCEKVWLSVTLVIILALDSEKYKLWHEIDRKLLLLRFFPDCWFFSCVWPFLYCDSSNRKNKPFIDVSWSESILSCSAEKFQFSEQFLQGRSHCEKERFFLLKFVTSCHVLGTTKINLKNLRRITFQINLKKDNRTISSWQSLPLVDIAPLGSILSCSSEKLY